MIAIECSDFQCPYCGKFAREIMPALKTQYIETGQVQLAFRHLPLTAIHARAKAAAQAAVCAAEQGKSFEFHDVLFGDGAGLEDVQARLRGLGIRYVVADATRAPLAARAGLTERARFPGVVIHEVPAEGGTRAPRP